MNPRNFRSRVWAPAVKAAGCEEVTPHMLRHLHASMLVEAGRPVTEIAQRLGHASAAVTMQVYAHWLQGDDAGAAAVIPEFGAAAG